MSITPLTICLCIAASYVPWFFITRTAACVYAGAIARKDLDEQMWIKKKYGDAIPPSYQDVTIPVLGDIILIWAVCRTIIIISSAMLLSVLALPSMYFEMLNIKSKETVVLMENRRKQRRKEERIRKETPEDLKGALSFSDKLRGCVSLMKGESK